MGEREPPRHRQPRPCQAAPSAREPRCVGAAWSTAFPLTANISLQEKPEETRQPRAGWAFFITYELEDGPPTPADGSTSRVPLSTHPNTGPKGCAHLDQEDRRVRTWALHPCKDPALPPCPAWFFQRPPHCLRGSRTSEGPEQGLERQVSHSLPTAVLASSRGDSSLRTQGDDLSSLTHHQHKPKPASFKAWASWELQT